MKDGAAEASPTSRVWMRFEGPLAIAAGKEGIADLRGVSVERFRVDRFKERGPDPAPSRYGFGSL